MRNENAEVQRALLMEAEMKTDNYQNLYTLTALVGKQPVY